MLGIKSIFNNLYSIDALLNFNLMSILREIRLRKEICDQKERERERRKKVQKLSNWLVVNLKTDI